MNSISTIQINKNRGWRGLAELITEDEAGNKAKIIFSFSSDVWKDMLNGNIVIEDTTSYNILKFDNRNELPKPSQQRSVLIKDFKANVIVQKSYSKDNYLAETKENLSDRVRIFNYINNSNRATTSTYNWVGIRVTANI